MSIVQPKRESSFSDMATYPSIRMVIAIQHAHIPHQNQECLVAKSTQCWKSRDKNLSSEIGLAIPWSLVSNDILGYLILGLSGGDHGGLCLARSANSLVAAPVEEPPMIRGFNCPPSTLLLDPLIAPIVPRISNDNPSQDQDCHPGSGKFWEIISHIPQGPDGALGRLANMQELVGKLGGGDLVGKNFGGGDLVGKNLNNIVGNLWKQQEEGSGSSHGNMVSSISISIKIPPLISIWTSTYQRQKWPKITFGKDGKLCWCK